MLVYPAGMSVSTQTLTFVTQQLRKHRRTLRTRWRVLSSHQQARMVLAHLRKGETYQDLAVGFGVGTTTAYRYLREALSVLAALAPTLAEAIQTAARKAYVTVDGTLLRIDRVAMASKRDRTYYSGKHKAHGVNVQVIADPAGRLIWASPTLPGSRHDMGAATEHGILTALQHAGLHAVADTGYQGAPPQVRIPQRRRRLDPDTGRYRPLSQAQKVVNTAHACMRGPGERANAVLKSWKILRKIRCCPTRATTLVNAVQVLILAG